MQGHPRDRVDIKKLEWAISISQAKLEEFRPGDWLNVREDFYRFVYGDGRDRSKAKFEKLTPEEIQTIQQHFKECFDFIAGGNLATSLRIDSGLDYQLLVTDPMQPIMQRIIVDDCALAAQLWLLSLLTTSRLCAAQIRKCPECKTVFLLRRKPQVNKNYHCSHKCAVTAANRAYRLRQDEAMKQNKREQAHDSYKRKVRGRPGLAKVKIERRPRKPRRTN